MKVEFSNIKSDTKKRMESAFAVLQKELSGLRSGRASPSLLESITVDAYGQSVALTQIGSVSAPESRLLVVQVWDMALVKSVEKAILESGLGLNPQTEGQSMRVPIPALSAERRAELVKVMGKQVEHAKISVRNVRKDSLDLLKRSAKKEGISEDMMRGFEKELQVITDDQIKAIDRLASQKEKEMLQL
jgi:ribosome recycling factor